MSTTALDSSVTLDEVFAVVATKRVPLAPELAGYLALELAEHADPGGGDVDPKSVFVGDEGTVALVKAKREGPCGDAEASIRAALGRLLEASGAQTPALAAASKRRSGAGLPALAGELEAALIPVNRAAARRALARLAREVKRVTLGVGRAALPSSSDVAPSSRRASSPAYTPAPPREVAPAAPAERGRALSAPPAPASFSREEEPTTTRAAVPDEILRIATPPPPRGEAPPAEGNPEELEPPTIEFDAGEPSPSQTDVDELIANFGVSGTSKGTGTPHTAGLKAIAGLEPTPPPPSRPLATSPSAPPARAVSQNESTEVDALLAAGDPAPADSRRASSDERQLPTQPSKLKQRPSLPSAPRVKPPTTSKTALVIPLLGIAAMGVFAVWRLRPTGGAGPAPELAQPSASSPAVAPPCKGTLVIGDVPPHAEVLLRQGQAPVDVERMPVGTRLEFVATAEGFAPKRVVVPAGATWDSPPSGAARAPRLEVAVQLDKSRAHPGTNDPWPASEPGSTVGGKGPPGTVHVVATPRGAEVWLLAGIGPEARVEQVSCDQDVDVLLAGPTTYRKRMRVAPGDFTADDSAANVARVSAK
jgi:hypothetical protein